MPQTVLHRAHAHRLDRCGQLRRAARFDQLERGFARCDEVAGEAAFAGFTNRFKLYRREVYDGENADDDDDGVDPLALVGRAARAG